MPQKRALVVDDSRSACLTLSRMLEKYALAVDTARSGDEALDYLRQHTPDVVFLDHMMPGLDGFQTLRAMQRDTAIGDVPVYMYTSKEDDGYETRARAVGAVGVLPKRARSAQLHDILTRLELVDAAAEAPPNGDEPLAEPSRPASGGGEHRPETQEESGMADAEDAEARWERHLRGVVAESVRSQLIPLQRRLDERRGGGGGGLIAGAVIALVALALGAGAALWLSPDEPAAPPALPDRLTGGTQPPAPDDAAPGRGAADGKAVVARPEALDLVAWALNQGNSYPFGELPFADNRLGVVTQLVERLRRLGFYGSVVLEGHVGRFCVVRNAADEWTLAPPDASMADCEAIGFGSEAAESRSARESLAFANFRTSAPFFSDGTMRLRIVAKGASEPRVDYPAVEAVEKAGTWNAVAAANHRVHYRLIPGPEGLGSGGE